MGGNRIKESLSESVNLIIFAMNKRFSSTASANMKHGSIPVVYGGKGAADLPGEQQKRHRNCKSHPGCRKGQASKNLKQHQRTADDDQKIRLHVKPGLYSDK